MLRLALIAGAILVVTLGFSQEKILQVPHRHQVYGMPDWTGGRTFEVVVDGVLVEKSILYASCWPVCMTGILVYCGQLANDNGGFSSEVARQYDFYADFDDGAHSWMIPDYLAKYYPDLSCELVDVSDLKLWTSERKWALVCDSIDHGWPVIASIGWVKPRGNIFGHAIVLRGYESVAQTAIVNDPAGSFTMTGRWDSSITGESLKYRYNDFFDRRFLIVVPIERKAELDAMIVRYSPPQPP